MANSTEETTTDKGTLLFEHLATNRPWLAKTLKEYNLIVFFSSLVFGTEDAFNLGYSGISLVISMRAAFHEKDSSSSELRDFHASSLGLAISLTTCGVLTVFSLLSTYFADADPEKDGLFFYAMGIIWSYLRAMLKAVKWAYKGIRSTLMLILLLSDSLPLLTHLLFPITIVACIFSLMACLALRYLRKGRQVLQAENDRLTLDTLAKHDALVILKELPKDNDNVLLARYKDALIILETENNEYKVYYVEAKETQDKAERKYEYRLVEIPLVDVDTPEEFKVATADAFRKELHNAQNAILAQQLRYFFPEFSKSTINFTKSLPNSPTPNEVIYLLESDESNQKGVYVLNKAGQLERNEELSKQFDNCITRYKKNGSLSRLHQRQLDYYIPSLKGPIEKLNLSRKFGQTYDEWAKTYQNIGAEKENELEAFFCYVLVFYLSLINAMYFYTGVFLLAAFCPQLFFPLLGIASVLFITYFFVQMYEERKYSKKFERKKIEVEVAVTLTGFRLIERELEFISDTKKIEELTQALFEHVNKYNTLLQELEKTYALSFWSALMMGLTCGLGFQGTISALMFLVLGVLILTSTACPPALIFAFMSVGITCFLFSAVRFVVSYRSYVAKIKQQQTLITEEDKGYFRGYLGNLQGKSLLTLAEGQKIEDLDWQSAYNCVVDPSVKKDILIQTRYYMERRALNPIHEFELMGWFEVWRLTWSGFTKTEKTFGEFVEPSSISVCIAILVCSVVIGLTYLVRAVGKMFPVSSKSKDPTTAPFEGEAEILEVSSNHSSDPDHGLCPSCGSGFFASRSALRGSSMSPSPITSRRGSPASAGNNEQSPTMDGSGLGLDLVGQILGTSAIMA